MAKELTAREIQSRGGKAYVKKYGKQSLVELGKKAAEVNKQKPGFGMRLSLLGQRTRLKNKFAKGGMSKPDFEARLAEINDKLKDIPE